MDCVIANTLTFISFTEIAGYCPNAVIWKTKISDDGIRITDVSEVCIKGFAWDSPRNSDISFKIDLKTGELVI